MKGNRMLLLLLLTPNEILKKTENRVLLSISELGPSTNGKDLGPRNSPVGVIDPDGETISEKSALLT